MKATKNLKICNMLLLGILVNTICYSVDLKELMIKYASNQKKVSTFIANGHMDVIIYRGNTEVVSHIQSRIDLYLKAPDLCKLIIETTGGAPEKSIIVQKGEWISQKLPGLDTVITSKVKDSMNLFNQYFFTNIDSIIDQPSDVKIADSIVENGEKFYVFEVKPGDSVKVPGHHEQEAIDLIRIFFNEHGMLARTIIFSKENEMIRTDLQYLDKDGIFVIVRMETKINQEDGIRLCNAITYDAVSVNTGIKDKEFEL